MLVRQTCATSGVSGIALTKLDVLDGFDELRICTGYRLDGAALATLDRLTPFRPIPDVLQRDRWAVRIPVDFRLRR